MKTPLSPRRPRGFTRHEVLVVLALLLALFGLLVPVVQWAREVASRVSCANNLRQITLATVSCADTNNGALPPAMGPYLKETSEETVFLHILPYIEQDNLYKSASDDKGNHTAWNNGVYGQRIKTYLCPRDSSAGAGHLYDGWLATGSYAANFLVFGTVSARYPASITDGTSNTIAFAERFQVCNQTPCGWGYGAETEWAPVFARSNYARFQVQPFAEQCNPALPQSAHPGGIQVALADCSVRNLYPAISWETWFAACTPAGGEVLGDDW
jgi:hypothetical protein